MATKRKTYTSPEVKDRWNRAHYDRVELRVYKGGKAEVQALADDAGLSVSEYIRQAVKEKAEKDGKSDILVILRGGGGFDPTHALTYASALAVLREATQARSTLY